MGNRLTLAVGWLGLALLVAGCADDGRKPTARAGGKVTFEGKPVTGGTLTYSADKKGPRDLPGKPAIAAIQPDGTFSFSTYGTNDGAVVGKGKLDFIAPPGKQLTPTIDNGDGTYTAGAVEPSPYLGCKVETPEVEIKAGGNQLEVKLKPKPAK